MDDGAESAREAVGFDDVEQAERRIAGQVEQTPFLHSRTLSDIAGAQLYLKFENLQFTASFKERGALNRLAQLPPEVLARGVLAVSAGNHAQGVAWHAKRLGAPATIVMPSGTSPVKIARTRALGATIVLHGERFDETWSHGAALAAERGLTRIDPFDDPAVIAGQGTVGLEIARSAHRLDDVVLPIGGGGLAAGVSIALHRLRPSVRVVGVQSERFALVHDALRGGRHPLGASTIADGIAVNRLGSVTLPLLRRHMDDVLLVDDARIEQAILLLLEIEKTVVEGAGAAGLAAVLAHAERFRGRHVGLVLTGGNIDPLLLAAIIERGLARSGRLARLIVDVRDAPGALARVTTLLAEERANIEQIHHERAFGTTGAQRVEVEIVVQTESPAHVERVLRRLRDAGFDARGD
ncbi:MAG: threonine ammonia-lyase [Burkholderiaceae bacterium]|nr:threonine ammonia-lyase [Burkholderiaceae bacterium]